MPLAENSVESAITDNDGSRFSDQQHDAARDAQRAKSDEKRGDAKPDRQVTVDEAHGGTRAKSGSTADGPVRPELAHCDRRRHAGQCDGRADGQVEFAGDDDESHPDSNDCYEGSLPANIFQVADSREHGRSECEDDDEADKGKYQHAFGCQNPLADARCNSRLCEHHALRPMATANQIIRPFTASCSDGSTPTKLSPLLSTPIIRLPTSAPMIVP